MRLWMQETVVESFAVFSPNSLCYFFFLINISMIVALLFYFYLFLFFSHKGNPTPLFCTVQ